MAPLALPLAAVAGQLVAAEPKSSASKSFWHFSQMSHLVLAVHKVDHLGVPAPKPAAACTAQCCRAPRAGVEHEVSASLQPHQSHFHLPPGQLRQWGLTPAKLSKSRPQPLSQINFPASFCCTGPLAPCRYRLPQAEQSVPGPRCRRDLFFVIMKYRIMIG